MGGNRWVEYDMPRSHPTLSTLRDPSDTSAIKALLDLQTGAQKTTSGQQQQIQPQQTTQVQRWGVIRYRAMNSLRYCPRPGPVCEVRGEEGRLRILR